MNRPADFVEGERDPDEAFAQAIAREFQDRWPARIEDHLPPPGPAYSRSVVLLCNVDLELRWRTSREGRAAEYFRRFPEVWDADGDGALELIAAEYELRRAHVRLEEFCRDYSDRRKGLAEELIGRFPPTDDSPRYRDPRLHARGGLGDVFIAQDAQLGRKVALKRLQRRHRHDRRHREQFLLEAETTGRLEHPGIIPVYGLERGGDGGLGYAMRFIGPEQGKTLRVAIDELHDPGRRDDGRAGMRGLRELLGRFVFACKTVDYAHGGYLHRDIKPENILVGRHGETWVIDWGLARPIKLSEGRSPPVGSPLGPMTEPGEPTREGGSISRGTRGYRSPEQARGSPDLGPGSDVYSLGATLDSLLSGQDRARAIREGLIPDEFSDHHPGPARSGTPRELRAICAKAMALDVEARYPSAAALAEDVQAFLDGERVAAWDEPLAARARRVLLKHQAAAVATLAAMILAVVLGGSLGLLAYRRKAAEVAREQAIAEAQGSLVTAMAELSRADVITSGRPRVDPLLVDRALMAIENLRRVERGESPRVREDWAITALKVAKETESRGSADDSKRAYRLARDIYADLVRDFPGNAGARRNLAVCHQNLANLESQTGESEAARRSLLAGASLLEPIVKEDRSDLEARFGLAKIRLVLANLEKGTQDVDAADREARSGLELMESLARDDPDRPDYLQHLARGLSTLGNVQGAAGRLSQALETHGRGLAIRDRLVRSTDDPRLPDYQADLALSHYNIGHLKGQVLDAASQVPRGGGKPSVRYEEVIGSLSRCAEIRESLCRFNQGDARLFGQLCQVRGEIGSVLLRHGPRDAAGLDRASTVIRAALDGYEQLKSRHPESTEFSEPFAACCQNLGIIQFLRKRPDDASAWFGRAESEYQGLLRSDPKNPRLLQLLGNQAFSVGNLLVGLDGSKAEARRHLERARRIQEGLVAESPGNRLYQRQLRMTMALLDRLR
jgi:tetratricopeptide (TPR) repeat protein